MNTKKFNLIGLALAIIAVAVVATAYSASPSGTSGLQTPKSAKSAKGQTLFTGGPALHVANPNTAPDVAAYSENDIRAYVASEQPYFKSKGALSDLTIDSVRFMKLDALKSEFKEMQSINNSPSLLVCVVIMSGPISLGDPTPAHVVKPGNGPVTDNHIMQAFDAHTGNRLGQMVYK
jgi:hypothetical protein